MFFLIGIDFDSSARIKSLELEGSGGGFPAVLRL
jgi:hypothetical protein